MLKGLDGSCLGFELLLRLCEVLTLRADLGAKFPQQVAVAVGVLAIFIGGLAFYLGCKNKRRSSAVSIPPELARGLEMSRFTPVGRTEINDGIDESTAI